MNELFFETARNSYTLSKKYGEGQGWVEIVGQHYQITHNDRFPYDFNNNISQLLGTALDRADSEYLGLIHNLTNLRLQEHFILPLFFSWKDHRYECVCGSSRRIANIAAGFENNCNTIYFTPHGMPALGDPVTSTQHYLDIFGLNDVDHVITLSNPNPNQYQVMSSVLTNSVYEKSNKDYFVKLGQTILDFWQKYRLGNRIKIIIHCSDQIRPLIRSTCEIAPGVPLFDVEWQEPDVPCFSFGRMLHNLAHLPSYELHLFVWGISQPFVLENLMSWCHKDCSCYYTENKKVLLLAPFDQTGFSIIGNFIK